MIVSLTEFLPSSGDDRSMVVPAEREAVFLRGRVVALLGGSALAAVRSFLERSRRPDMLSDVEEAVGSSWFVNGKGLE